MTANDIPVVHDAPEVGDIARRVSTVLIEIEQIIREAGRVRDLPPSAIDTTVRRLENARVYLGDAALGIAAWPSVQGTWRRTAAQE